MRLKARSWLPPLLLLNELEQESAQRRDVIAQFRQLLLLHGDSRRHLGPQRRHLPALLLRPGLGEALQV